MKKRLDLLVFEKGLAESREKAKSIIMSGLVYIKNQKYDKPGETVDEDSQIEVRGKGLRYVSRGGLKLEKAMQIFPVNIEQQICMDVGASTGGFTDCMLQNGAAKVYAVDVGYGQLAWSLRTDARVINLERTNARYLSNKEIPDKIFLTSVDVSFISLTKILPAIHDLLQDKGYAVCLIKPQFEAGRDKVGKKGVVRDKDVHEEVIKKIIDFALSAGFSIRALTFSPVKGPEGNIEYLIQLQKEEAVQIWPDVLDVKTVVKASHQELDGAAK
ncbi:TlyA family RNA methyltransferase [Scatolibacter rhodanostii]|uniref:TlyA family RNA methyltransferase n=1 Tax=Scatolibacter rhodanostii TaxID=2014781 RepID=UPI000C0744BE|nr:TlyA family RNA methyltransferase [Scatolibacter rhodanostii]